MTWTQTAAYKRAHEVADEIRAQYPSLDREVRVRLACWAEQGRDGEPLEVVTASVTVGRYPAWSIVPSANGQRETPVDHVYLAAEAAIR